MLSFIYPELSGSGGRVFGDNQGAIALAENSLGSARSQHIDVRFHFIRELLRAKKIDVCSFGRAASGYFDESLAAISTPCEDVSKKQSSLSGSTRGARRFGIHLTTPPALLPDLRGRQKKIPQFFFALICVPF